MTYDQIHFVGLHHETALRAFHRPSSPSTPIIVYRDPLFQLRAIPTRTLPTPPPGPFPPSLQSSSFRAKHGERAISFGVVASKSNVSKLASERLRARSRVKAAVEAVVYRSVGLRERTSGSDMINTGELPLSISHRRHQNADTGDGRWDDAVETDGVEWSYLALLSREVYEASMEDLCKSVAAGLIWIKRLQEKGIGSDRHHAPSSNRTTSESTGGGGDGGGAARRPSRRPLYPRPVSE